MNEQVYVAPDYNDGCITILGNEHQWDGRRILLHRNGHHSTEIVISNGRSTRPILAASTWRQACTVYEAMKECETLDEIMEIADEATTLPIVGQWVVYLLHFDQKVGKRQPPMLRAMHGHGPRKQEYNKPHAGHYIGHTNDLPERMKVHKNGDGSRLVAALIGQGGTFHVAQVWTHDENGDELDGMSAPRLERKLKARKNSPKMCAICNSAD